MTAIFGRKRQGMKPSATGLQIQTSSNAIPVPIAWGRGRLAPNIIWYDNFKTRKVKVGGGKGASSQKTYKYSVSVILGICEGPIDDVNNVWRDLYFQESGSSFQSSHGAVEYLGTYAQTPWSYLTTNYPDAALSYRGLAYLGLPNYDLGEDPSMPQHSFEINGILYNTAVGGASSDADPADLVYDFLTNEYYGTPFKASAVNTDTLYSTPAAPTTGDNTYQTYCRAMGFGLSPVLSDTEDASSILERWLLLTNTQPVWSGNQLKFVPYGDETVSANGVVYVPDLTVQYNLTEDDFIYAEGEDPVKFVRGDPQDAKNAFYLEVEDRGDAYSLKPVGARDQASVEQYGKLQADNITAHEIKDLDMADTIVHLLLQRSAYVRNKYQFKLPQNFIRLEAMDIVTLTWSGLGMDAYRVRITEVTENEDGELEIIAEDFPNNLGSTASYTPQSSTATPINSNQAPGNIETPIIFEPPAQLTDGSPEVWVGATGAGQYWGGCEVWLSTDNTTYFQIGEIDNLQRIGTLSAILATYGGSNPDTGNTLSVDLTTSKGELESGDPTDVALGANLCYVDGELISFENATLTATYEYDLTDLYRGFYDTTIGAHALGTQFAYLDESIFKYALPDDYIGTLLYIKFLSFNLWGVAVQQLADVSPYTYTPTGQAFSITPASSVAATGGSGNITVTWAGSPSVNVTGYKIYAIENPTGTFGASTLVGTVASGTLSFIHAGLGSLETWRYWVVAYNAQGDATEAGPANATTLETQLGVDVYDNGTPVLANALGLNFVGGTISDDGGGIARVEYSGGGGGGAAFTVIASATITTPVAQIDIDVSGYDEVLVLLHNVTKSALQSTKGEVSTDGGSTFYTTSGDYVSMNDSGTRTFQTSIALSGNSASALSGYWHMFGISDPTTLAKFMNSTSGAARYFFEATSAAITDIRLHASGVNFTGGDYIVLGR